MDTRDGAGRTALMLAARVGALSVVQFLVGAGSPVFVRDALGRDASFYSRYYGHTAVSDYLGVGVSVAVSRGGWYLLAALFFCS